jgi:hypothetical protein
VILGISAAFGSQMKRNADGGVSDGRGLVRPVRGRAYMVAWSTDSPELSKRTRAADTLVILRPCGPPD